MLWKTRTCGERYQTESIQTESTNGKVTREIQTEHTDGKDKREIQTESI